ncbi:MAG TPA: DUF2721 domain-containing protein [Devosiaceae bacterium]|jgi:hypothetical protein|nr:DUF2721 domain-containing protein [Devosiaceae bacterium]
MFGSLVDAGTGVEVSAHLIQVALTPVFLLTAIAGFLNVFTGRLARVADRVNAITRARLEGQPITIVGISADLNSLRRRTLALQAAVVLAGVSGASTCAATFTIFVGTLGANLTSLTLFIEFGLALLSLLGALTCFVVEMVIASRAMIAQIATDREGY